MYNVSNAWIQGRSEVVVYGEKAEQRSCAGEGQGTHSTPGLSLLTVNSLGIIAPKTVEEEGRVGFCMPYLGYELLSCRSRGVIKALVSTYGDSVHFLLIL